MLNSVTCAVLLLTDHSHTGPELGLLYAEVAMGNSLLMTLLFLGNVVLFWLWASYVLKIVRGHCPHCGR